MKLMKIVLLFISFFVLIAIVIAVYYRGLERSYRYQKILGLEREIVSYAILNNGDLPASWEHYVQFQGLNTAWTVDDLKRLGTLRWGWNIHLRPDDSCYLYINNETFRQFEDDFNREMHENVKSEPTGQP